MAPLSNLTFEYYADKIRCRWSQDNASILRLATLCSRAVDRNAVCDHRKLILATGISKQSFSKLKNIAEETRFSAKCLRRKLPNNLYALDAIRKLTDYQILAAVEDGIIGPNCSEWRIKRWLNSRSAFRRHILEKMIGIVDTSKNRFELMQELAPLASMMGQERIHGSIFKNSDWHFKQFRCPAFHETRSSSGPTSSSV